MRWNAANVKSSYANFYNASSTREEVVLHFGSSHDRERSQQNMEIELLHRIVLSPFAAKRLLHPLSKLVTDYETRYGELKWRRERPRTDLASHLGNPPLPCQHPHSVAPDQAASPS